MVLFLILPQLLLYGFSLYSGAINDFNPLKTAEIESAILNAIKENALPGAVLYIESDGRVYHNAFGSRALVPTNEPMSIDTIFDLASLTKVIATAPSIMLLAERGKLNIDDPVKKYIPEFNGEGCEEITIRHLLTHFSGLRAGISPKPEWQGYELGIAKACQEKPINKPGTTFRYSDINFILLGEIVRRVSGLPLNEFAKNEIFLPLKMTNTFFNPAVEKIPLIAPTQIIGKEPLRGVVHDPVARNMKGVAGHAGLFSTSSDLARFARMLLNKGELDGVRIFKPETIQSMTSVQSPTNSNVKRGFGWDIDSGYSRLRGKLFPIGSFGHTGFTGTAIWIDPFSNTFWIFLSNRVHPDGSGNILNLQATLGTLIARLTEKYDTTTADSVLSEKKQLPEPVQVPQKPVNVLNGIDVLMSQNFEPLKNLRIGLIINHTSHNRDRISALELLKQATNVVVKAIFTPEHGISGTADELIKDSHDPQTGIPIFSLYGERKSPTKEQLKDLDALVFDIQDIGCRFYTYITTMSLCMESAAKNNLKFFVLDRVNPITANAVEGPVFFGVPDFTACHSIPIRYGMTIGELALMINSERNFKADLRVIKVSGWHRKMWFDETVLPWTNPSPNMRNLRAAILYPGIGLLETALSVGRGTDTPFEIVGAPYIKDTQFAEELNKLKLAGVSFLPIRFTPNYSTFKDKQCEGVSIIITDRNKIEPVDVGISIAIVARKLYPENFELKKVNALLKDQKLIDAIRSGMSLPEIKSLWLPALEEFKKRREKFLLYN